jgi:hypothetical protein
MCSIIFITAGLKLGNIPQTKRRRSSQLNFNAFAFATAKIENLLGEHMNSMTGTNYLSPNQLQKYYQKFLTEQQ